MSSLTQLTRAHMQTTKAKGDAGEIMAGKYLEEKGMKILQRNFRYDRGEIDIVAEDEGEIVFVEVKSRQTHTFGSPEEAITPQKESYLQRTAEGYLLQRGLEDKSCRFDAIAIDWKGGDPEIRHIKNAF